MSVNASAEPLPPPRLFFSVSHYKELQDDEDKAYIGYYCRLDIAYPPGSNKKDMSHVILRRWSHFVMFDQEWAKFYPPLHEQCHLPTKVSFTSVFNKIKLADKRKLILQQYVEKLLTIVCLQDFVAQFLEIDYNFFKSTDPPRAATPPSPTSPGPEKDNKPEETQSNGVRIIQSTGYVREGPDPKGNTDKASRKAYKMKAKFEEENKELLSVLLKAKGGGGVPSIKLNLPFLTSNIAAANDASRAASPSTASAASATSPSPIPPSSPMLAMTLSSTTSAANSSANAATSPLVPPSSQNFMGASPPVITRTAPPPPPQKNLNIPAGFVASQQRSSFAAANTNIGSGTTNLSLLQENNSNGRPSPALPSKLKSAAPPPLTSVSSAASKIEAFNNINNNNSNNPASPTLPNRPTARPPKRDWGSFTAVPGSNLLSPTSSQQPSSPIPPAAAPLPPAVPAPPIPPTSSSFVNKGAAPPVPPAPPAASSAAAAPVPPPMPPSLPTSKPALPFGGLKKPTIPAVSPSIPAPPVPTSKPSPFGPSIHDKPATAAPPTTAANAPPPPPLPPSLSKPPPLPVTNVGASSSSAAPAAAATSAAKWCSECGSKRENPAAKFCDQCGHKF